MHQKELIIKLINREKLLRNYLTNKINCDFDLDSIIIEEQNNGLTNKVYKVGFNNNWFIFKFFGLGHFFRFRVNKYYEYHNILYELSITNKIIYYNDNFSVEEYIEGNHLIVQDFAYNYKDVIDKISLMQGIRLTNKQKKPYYFEFLRKFKILHNYPKINLRNEIDIIIKQIKNINNTNELLNIKLSHADLKFNNILKNNNNIVFIDFDALCYDWCLMDIAIFSLNYIESPKFNIILNKILKYYLSINNTLNNRPNKQDKILLLLCIKITIIRNLIGRYRRYLLYSKNNETEIALRNKQNYHNSLKQMKIIKNFLIYEQKIK